MPADLPSLTWTDVDDAEVEAWFQGKMDLQSEQGQKWADAWIAYQDAITKPWNDFVTRAEDLSVEDANLDMQTDEEVIRFIADNTFVEGVSLTDKYPEIDTWIAEMKAQADWEQYFNFDAIRIPVEEAPVPAPVTMQADYYYDDETYVEEPTEFEQAMTEIKNQVMEYGYDPEVVTAWFESTGVSWEELSKKQDTEAMEKAQADIRTAADYVKGIFDNMVVDLQNRQVEDQARFESEVDGFVGELKNKVDEQAKENISNLDNWFADKYD